MLRQLRLFFTVFRAHLSISAVSFLVFVIQFLLLSVNRMHEIIGTHHHITLTDTLGDGLTVNLQFEEDEEEEGEKN